MQPCTVHIGSISELLPAGAGALSCFLEYNRADKKHTVHVNFQNRERFQNMFLFALETHLHEIFYVLVPTCSLHCQQVRLQCHPKPHTVQKEAPLALAGLVGGPKNLAKPEESSTGVIQFGKFFKVSRESKDSKVSGHPMEVVCCLAAHCPLEVGCNAFAKFIKIRRVEQPVQRRFGAAGCWQNMCLVLLPVQSVLRSGAAYSTKQSAIAYDEALTMC